VRVPREAVLGYEGHGQVNALETLNVGRCGLAAVAGALARKLLTAAAVDIPPSPERDRYLGEAAAIQFGSESLAYYLIGLFDRPHESVRMESAIAKFACSEDLHDILSLVEQASGPESQTEKLLIEKARRDARILNIYEGTNEVQRFLVLKDLIAQAADWPVLPETLPERPEDLVAVTLSKWKNRLRVHVKAASGKFGTSPGPMPCSSPASSCSRRWRRRYCGSNAFPGAWSGSKRTHPLSVSRMSKACSVRGTAPRNARSSVSRISTKDTAARGSGWRITSICRRSLQRTRPWTRPHVNLPLFRNITNQ